MIVSFSNNIVTVTSTGEVFKSEDGENYSFLFKNGEYFDQNLCLPSKEECPNYYFYSGDGTIKSVACKTC